MTLNEAQEIRILMVDDHPMIIEAYKDVLARLISEHIHFAIDSAHTCDSAWKKIDTESYDILFLDMSFPDEESEQFVSGEDLGIKIREEYSELKIIILTQIEDAFHLNNLMASIKPDGFLLKRETNPRLLEHCVQSVIASIPFFSPKIAKIMRSGKMNNMLISENDRVILHQLSLGTKTKNLHRYISLSNRAIEDRKRRLREIFGADDDKSLLARAKERGYI